MLAPYPLNQTCLPACLHDMQKIEKFLCRRVQVKSLDDWCAADDSGRNCVRGNAFQTRFHPQNFILVKRYVFEDILIYLLIHFVLADQAA